MIEELKALGYQKNSSPKAPGQYHYNDNEFLITTRGFEFWDLPEPSRTVQVGFSDDKVISLKESHPDRPLALLRLEPQLIGKIYPSHNEDRILVRLDEVPDALSHALVAMEDRQFSEHWGISIRGLVRAFVANFRAGKRVQGGSTLTQQLVKNFYLSSERTFKRKINEAIMALLLEWHYSKNEILEVYMNEVYLGQAGKRAIHGMGLAAQFFFNRPLKELELPQFALLVTLVRGASLYNPRKHPERAKKRRNLVLDVMLSTGKISKEEAKAAKEAPLGLEKNTGILFPAFFELVRRQLNEYYKKKDLDLHSQGLQIVTTLDPVIQKAAEKAMVEGLEKLEKKHRDAQDLQGAMIVVGSQNGEVLAMVNGKTTHSIGFNRPLDAERQIGSLVKPAIYLAATAVRNRIGLLRIGERVKITVIRKGRTRHLDVVIADSKRVEGSEISVYLEGAVFKDSSDGIEVYKVTRNSNAWQIGLRRGDRLVGLNRKEITNLDEFKQRFSWYKTPRSIQILRDGKISSIWLEK
ncbi:penicillin-binding protein 1B [Candidatus Thiomargarita nelsonii]|uniref:Penicillin-binding protein 1B n=1 Tax=Candidatus Thiomargarita nelsonii TaxID=1003181 RepID=A0A176S7J1_9GAMM|nr:penicillin-binding protein 1B [Candidatus Thiomargarita nelsonii]